MAGQRRTVGGLWCAWALAGALLLAACGGGGGGGGAPAVFATLGGSVVKGITQFGRITGQELDVNGAVVRELGTAVTDAQGVYSLDLPAGYTGGPILLTLSDNLDPARPTMVKCDRWGGCGTFGFGDPMPIGSLVMTALHPGTSTSGATLTLQVTAFTHVAARYVLTSGQPVDAALVNAVHEALSDLLGGVDLATVQPVDMTDPDALAAGADFTLYYGYLSAAVAGVAFGQYGSSADPFAAALNALVNAFAGGVALYDDGGSDPAFLSLKELFAEALVQIQGNPSGNSGVELNLTSTDNAASVGSGLNLLPDRDGDGTPDYADACPLDDQNDADGDGVCGDVDACPGFDDAADADADGTPDGCDVCPGDPEDDADGDGICVDGGFNDPAVGDFDNCPAVANPDQLDADADGLGDACDLCPDDLDNDSDGDGLCTAATFNSPAMGGLDNCPSTVNPDQADSDTDGLGDACDDCPFDPENDADGDGVCGDFDQCPGFDDRLDADFDFLPDGCDLCPGDPTNDFDSDGICAGTGFNAPAVGDGDNCPDLSTTDLTDTDGDGVGDACDLCPADADNDSDGDGVCVAADFSPPAVAGNDNCPTVPNPDQADANENGEGDVCEGGIITIGEVQFDPAESADLGTHALAIPTQDAWPFIGYDGTDGGYGVFFTQTTERGVAVTELAVTPGGGGAGVYDLAKATDGAIYYLHAKELDGQGGSSEVIFQNPALFLPATLPVGATWEDHLDELLWADPVATMEVTGAGVTSPAGYADTIAIQSTQDGGVEVQYWRTGGGIVDAAEDGGNHFRRADAEPSPTSPMPTTGALKTLQPGDTWTYLETGVFVDADGHFDPNNAGAGFRTVTVQDRTVTETGVGCGLGTVILKDARFPAGPGPLRTAGVLWGDWVQYDPNFGGSMRFSIEYFNQNGDLRHLGRNGCWVLSPEEGIIDAPGTMSVGQTYGDTYDDGFRGIETYNVVQGNVGVQTPAGNFQTFRIEYSDVPVPGEPQFFTNTSTDWFSPAVGAMIQTIGKQEVLATGEHFRWSDRLVGYGTVPADRDTDGDAVPDLQDNCPPKPNAGQEDTNGDGMGDACGGLDVSKPLP